MLQCGHNLCKQCLLDLNKEVGGRIGAHCPTCRTYVTFTRESEITVDPILQAAVEVMRGEAVPRVPCMRCETVEATLDCSDCNAKFCSKCSDLLHVGKLRTHRLNYDAASVHLGSKPPNCAHLGHEDYRMDLFCADCRCMLCVLCSQVLPTHQTHHVIPLAEAAEVEKQNLRQTLRTVQGFHAQLKGSVDRVDRAISECDRVSSQEIRAFDSLFSELMSRIEKRRNDLITEAQNIAEKQIGALRLSRDRLVDIASTVNEALSTGERALNLNTTVAIVKGCVSVETHLTKCTPVTIPETFLPHFTFPSFQTVVNGIDMASVDAVQEYNASSAGVIRSSFVVDPHVALFSTHGEGREEVDDDPSQPPNHDHQPRRTSAAVGPHTSTAQSSARPHRSSPFIQGTASPIPPPPPPPPLRGADKEPDRSIYDAHNHTMSDEVPQDDLSSRPNSVHHPQQPPRASLQQHTQQQQQQKILRRGFSWAKSTYNEILLSNRNLTAMSSSKTWETVVGDTLLHHGVTYLEIRLDQYDASNGHNMIFGIIFEGPSEICEVVGEDGTSVGFDVGRGTKCVAGNFYLPYAASPPPPFARATTATLGKVESILASPPPAAPTIDSLSPVLLDNAPTHNSSSNSAKDGGLLQHHNNSLYRRPTTAFGAAAAASQPLLRGGSGAASVFHVTTGDVLGMKVDYSAGDITFYHNGDSLGVAFTGLAKPSYPAVSLIGKQQITLQFPSKIPL